MKIGWQVGVELSNEPEPGLINLFLVIISSTFVVKFTGKRQAIDAKCALKEISDETRESGKNIIKYFNQLKNIKPILGNKST